MAPPGPSDRDDDAAERADKAIEATVRVARADPPRPDRPPLARGDLMARYVITELLGEGGMGEVYAAVDPELGRRVAIKVLKDRGDPSEITEGRARLLREAQAMAKLSHPNVVSVFDVGVVDDRVFLAMELVEGHDLKQWLRARPRSWREILDVAIAAGRGLAAAHQAGIVHRDFKPDNVLVGDDGRVCVSDFGIARASPTAEPTPPSARAEARDLLGTELTRRGALVGTLAYMAPEQLDGKAATVESDQFSFCVTLYEALFRERPYEPPSPDPTDGRLRFGAARPTPKRGDVPRWVTRLLARGLELDPARRFASVEELVDELESTPRRARSRVVLAGGAIVLTALAALALTRGSPTEPRCDGGAEAWREVWNDDRRAAVRSAFDATGPLGVATFPKIDHRLDEYGAAWAAMSRESCRATLVLHEQSPERLDQRSACLRERLGEVRSVTQVLAHADLGVVASAVTLLSDVAPVDVCGLAASARSSLKPPSPELRPRVEEIRAELAGVLALMRLRRYQEALARARSAHAHAVALGYAPLVGEALLRVGGSLGGATRDYEAADQSLHQAILIAIAQHHDMLELRAWSERQNVMDSWVLDTTGEEKKRRLASYRTWLELWEAAIHRAGDDPIELGLLDGAWAMFEEDSDRSAAARARYEAGLERLSHVAPGATGVHDATTVEDMKAAFHRGIADAAWRADQREVARGHLLASLALQEAELGDRHPDLSMTLRRLADLDLEEERFDAARASAEHATRLVWGEARDAEMSAWVQLGASLRCGEKAREAQAAFDRGLALAAELPEKLRAELVPEKQLAIGLCYLRDKRFAEARAWLDRAMTGARDGAADGHELRLRAALALGELALATSDLALARRSFDDADKQRAEVEEHDATLEAELAFVRALANKAEHPKDTTGAIAVEEALKKLEATDLGRIRRGVLREIGVTP